MVEEFHPYGGAEVRFAGDDVGELVPYTVTYSVILITEHALVVVGRGGSKGSTMTVVVVSRVVVDVSTAAALTSSGGGP